MDKRIKNSLKPQDVVSLYTIQHLSCTQIALIAGVTRQQIWKILGEQGINTSKGEGGATRVKYECDFCGKSSEMFRARWRNSIKHYCSDTCYFASIENPGYHPWRQGQWLARAIVNQYFQLLTGHVIHHKDGNGRNNDLSNLNVFESQSDHLKFHRGKNHVKPIWDYTFIPKD